ncbi:MAG: restriction endonuclease subunit S [ANME-2 cluster archaeon]|nr:restriction endonuclease subunit S [ANME-2 cluster archaeon]
MSEWKEFKLGDVVVLNYGKGLPEQKRIEGNVPVYSSAGLTGYHNKPLVNSEGLIIGRKGTVGKIYYSKNPFFCIDTAYYILPDKEKYSLNFIYYLLKTIGLAELNEDSAVPGLNRNTAYSQEILLPPLPEQRAIASVLSSLDDKIDLLHRQNRTLEGMAEALFRQWFVEEADEGWNSVRVGDFVHTNVSSINKDNALKTIRYLDTGSLTEGKIDGYQILDIADAPSRARRIVKNNDILISTVRPNQKHYGILKNPAENVIVSTGFCVITCDKINPHFIYILLTTDEMTEYLHSIAEGSTSTYPSLKPSDIEGLEFQLPSKEKLDAFSEYADDAWNKIEYNHTQIRTLEKLRDTLLPKLISGQIRLDYIEYF